MTLVGPSNQTNVGIDQVYPIPLKVGLFHVTLEGLHPN